MKKLAEKYPQGTANIADDRVLAPVFTKEDLWDAWWQSAIKTCSFTGVDKEYERRCFERFYDNKLASIK